MRYRLPLVYMDASRATLESEYADLIDQLKYLRKRIVEEKEEILFSRRFYIYEHAASLRAARFVRRIIHTKTANDNI